MAACESMWASMRNVNNASCFQESVTAGTGSAVYVVKLQFSTDPSMNNIFTHDGNPALSEFSCDIAAVTDRKSLYSSCLMVL